MKVIESQSPRDHLVIDNFFSPRELAVVWSEIVKLGPKLRIGIQSPDAAYSEVKNNRNVVVFPDSKIQGHKNEIWKILNESLKDKKLLNETVKMHSPMFYQLKFCSYPSVHLSSYHDGEFYGRHMDANDPTNLTIILFICKNPRQFSGGNFVLEYGEKKKVIAFKNNRLLVFPSNTNHYVTRVRIKNKKFENGRFSLQMWPELSQSVVRVKNSRNWVKSYYVPSFKIQERHWKSFQSLMTKKSGLPFDKYSSADQKTITEIVMQLRSNLMYMGRGAFFDHKPLTSTDVANNISLDRGQFRITSTFRYRGSKVSYGYAIERKNRKMSLKVFLIIRQKGKSTYETFVDFPHHSDFKTTVKKLAKMFERLPDCAESLETFVKSA